MAIIFYLMINFVEVYLSTLPYASMKL